jgi:alanyl-tRNA synthetase
MQYEKKDGKVVGKLAKPSVDTGAGLERLAMTLQGVDNIYDTDLLKPIINITKGLSNNLKGQRIIADHVRSAVFLIADGIVPSPDYRGYVLRKLIRNALANTHDKKIDGNEISILINNVVDTYQKIYPNIKNQASTIKQVIQKEVESFSKTLEFTNTSEFKKEIFNLAQINIEDQQTTSSGLSADKIFNFHQSRGIPIDLIFDEINKVRKENKLKNIPADIERYFKNLLLKIDEKNKKHQELSRVGAEQKFKGGLADANDPMVVRYHTATHLLQQALHDVLGEESGNQKGSNITAERLRYDFTGVKLTDEQKKKVEAIVNDKIKSALPVNQVILPRAEAEKTGAQHFFGEKYGDQISIYYIGKDLASAYSKEFCGGPHVKNTSELAGPEGKWKFKIQKEEASSQGVRRIKAVLD